MNRSQSVTEHWVPIGFDVRCFFELRSGWEVGDLTYSDFTGSTGCDPSRIERILTFDLNLSRQPWDIEGFDNDQTNPPLVCHANLVDAVRPLAKVQCDGCNHTPVYWETTAEGRGLLDAEKWFEAQPPDQVIREPDWMLVGMDIVNGDACSELWDVFENFWLGESKLQASLNSYGLIDSEEIVLSTMWRLPLDPLTRWAAPIRAWIPA